MNYLVIMRMNWADEFDIHGFQIMNQEQLDRWKENAHEVFEKNDKDYLEVHWKGGRSFEFSSFNDYISNFTITPIKTGISENIIKKYIGDSFGEFVYLEY